MMLYSRFALGRQFNKSVCRTVALFLAVLLCFSLCACTGKEEEDTGTDETTAAEPDPAYGTVRAEDRDDGVLRVLLDAGHGFGDVGCQSPYGFDEKDLTIIFARLLADELKERGAEVYLTHDGETRPTEAEITAAADRLGISCDAEKIVENEVFSAYERSVWENITDAEKHIDLFVSLHINSIEDAPQCSGFSVDWYEGNPQAQLLRELGENLRERLEDEYSKEVRLFSDSLEEAYIVNKYTNVPSVLIELGYATNEDDAACLQNPEWQKSVCAALAEVITDTVH